RQSSNACDNVPAAGHQQMVAQAHRRSCQAMAPAGTARHIVAAIAFGVHPRTRPPRLPAAASTPDERDHQCPRELRNDTRPPVAIAKVAATDTMRLWETAAHPDARACPPKIGNSPRWRALPNKASAPWRWKRWRASWE